MSGFDFSETRRLQQQLLSTQREFDSFIKDFLLKQGLEVVGIAKENTNVITGLLRNSWTVQGVKREGNSLVVTIVNPTEYASFVEYGHMNRGRTNWVEGQFICTLAIDEVYRLMPQRFQAAFANWAREMGL